MKKCNGPCGETKEDSEFTVRRYKSGRIGLKSRCNDCRHKARMKWRAADPKDNNRNKAYNKAHAQEIRGRKLVKNYWPDLTWQGAIAEWDKLFAEQGGHCALCSITTRLHVDHCHTTGKVRGLLCYNHNNGLGRFQDNPDTLIAAAAYLNKNTS